MQIIVGVNQPDDLLRDKKALALRHQGVAQVGDVMVFFAFAVLIQKLGAADLDTLVAGLDQAVAADHADSACARRRRDRLAAVQTMDALLAHGLVVIGVIQRVGEIGRLPIDRNDVHPLRLATASATRGIRPGRAGPPLD